MFADTYADDSMSFGLLFVARQREKEIAASGRTNISLPKVARQPSQNFCAKEMIPLKELIETSLKQQDNDFEKHFLQITGLCEKSGFDDRYSWDRELKNGRYNFRGFINSLIFWDDQNFQWRLENEAVDATDPFRIFAIANGTEYPFGVRKWLFNKDPCDVIKTNVTYPK